MKCESYTSPLNKLAYVLLSPTQSTQSVKLVVVLWKRSHNHLSPRLCSKMRNACRRSITQRLVSWSSPVVPKVWVETRTRVAKGQKMGRAEVIQTGVVCFRRYHCLSVCSLGTWEKSRLLTLRTNLATYCQNHSCNHYFSICCLRRVHETQIWIVLKKVWEPLI